MSNIPDPNRQRVMLNWLIALAELTTASNVSPPGKERLLLTVDMLGEGLSSDVFCRPALLAMARKFKWFPAAGELEAALIEWRDEEAVRRRMAARPAIEGPAGAQLTATDRQWVDWYHAHGGEYRDAHCRSLLARYSPAAYATVFGETVEQRREDRATAAGERIAAVAAAWRMARGGADSPPPAREPDKPAPVTPRHIPDADLLAAYERQAADPAQPFSVREAARTRADTIRRKLGQPVAANDRDKPQEDARP